MEQTKMQLPLAVALAGVVGLAGLGCESKADGGGTPIAVHLRVAAPATAFADSCGNTLTSARIVIREFEMDQTEDADEALDLESGPFLIDLVTADFNGTFQQNLLLTEIPAGEYDEVEFEVHKLESSDEHDAVAAAGDPALDAMLQAGESISITGVNSTGGAFSFSSDLSETQEKALDPTVVVGDSVTGIEGVTLSIDPNGWFGSGAACLDPNDPANESLIEDAIKASIDLDEDDDGNGEADPPETPGE